MLKLGASMCVEEVMCRDRVRKRTGTSAIVDRARGSMSEDYYSILGVPKDATSQDIKRSFRHIARECHPDVSGGSQEAEERFRQARQAYETLMDPVTRARYDRRRQRRQQMGGSFFDAFYNRSGGGDGNSTGPSYAPNVSGGSGTRRGRRHDSSNELDLEDLFNDFNLCF